MPISAGCLWQRLLQALQYRRSAASCPRGGTTAAAARMMDAPRAAPRLLGEQTAAACACGAGLVKGPFAGLRAKFPSCILLLGQVGQGGRLCEHVCSPWLASRQVVNAAMSSVVVVVQAAGHESQPLQHES